MPDNVSVLLVGCGEMAVEYSKVLCGLGIQFVVVGRGEEKAEGFEKSTGIRPLRGGIENVSFDSVPTYAIIAVGIEQLKNVSEAVLRRGVPNVLIEKPGGLYLEDVEYISSLAKEMDSSVFVAYNRRFYESTRRAMEIIDEDGGVSSFNFEFTEWAHEIETLKIGQKVKEEWLYGNSSHVIDLAFFLGGKPRSINCYSLGSLAWHKKGSIFAGAGISDKGALFCYQANWDAPGRWSVEILTRKHRLIFRPMEELQIQEKGSVSVCTESINTINDKKYKPGLFAEVNSFLFDQKDPRLVSIDEQVTNWRIFEEIEKGNVST